MADLQSPSADWPLATPWARTRRQKRRGEGRPPHWGADRFLARFSDPRKLHCDGSFAAAVLRVSSPIHLLGWPRGRYRPRGQHRQTSPSVSAPVRVLAFVFAAEMRIPLSGTPEGAALIG